MIFYLASDPTSDHQYGNNRPLSFYTTWAKARFPIDLALKIDRRCHQGIYYQIITDNIVLCALLLSIFQRKWIAKWDQSFYTNHFTLQRCTYWALAHSSNCLGCLGLGQCSMNCPFPSKLAKENKLAWESTGFDVSGAFERYELYFESSFVLKL